MVLRFKEDVRVCEYELTAEERRLKKSAMLHIRYAQQLRKNKLKEELRRKKRAAKAAAAAKAQAVAAPPRRRTMLPAGWSTKYNRGLRRQLELHGRAAARLAAF
mmetsp:Transcript_2995/g.8916  ORF Transcript_2995/g.8916 Transcript_2995/m.8916 type:complete len:104 (+) Transcript_2995:244-555(+)